MGRRAPLLAAFLALAQVFAALGSTAATLIFARLMGAGAFGQAMVILSVAGLASLAVSLNVEGGAMRFMLQGTAAARTGFRDTSRWLVLALGLPVGAICAGIGWAHGLAPLSLVTLAGLPMLLALARVTARLGASLGAVRAATLPRLLTRPLVLGLAAGMFWASGSVPTATGIVALALFAAAVAVAVQGIFLNRRFAHMGPGGRTKASPWLRTGLQLVPSLLFLELYRDLVLAAAAPGLGADRIGSLAAALSLVALPGFALVATEVVFAPRISRAIAENDPAARDRWLRMAAATRIAGVAGFAMALVLLAKPIAGFLGPQFAAAGDLLPVLLLIPLARMLAGNPVLVLTLAGRSADVMVICGIGAVLVATAVLLTGIWGSALAVASAAAIGFAATQLCLTLRCQSATGIDATGLLPRRAALLPA